MKTSPPRRNRAKEEVSTKPKYREGQLVHVLPVWVPRQRHDDRHRGLVSQKPRWSQAQTYIYEVTIGVDLDGRPIRIKVPEDALV